MHCDTANANDAGVDETIDSGQRSDCVNRRCQWRTDCGVVRRQVRDSQRKPRQPNQDRRKEKEVEEAINQAKTEAEKQNLEGNRYLLASIIRQQKTLDFIRNL